MTSDAQVVQEAEHGCAIYHKQAVPVSSSCIGLYCQAKTRLFACTEEP